MYKIVNVTDKQGNPKKSFMDEIRLEHPSLEGEILNESLLQSNMFLGSLRFKWNDDSGKMLTTSYVTDWNRKESNLVINTINSIYTLEHIKDDKPIEDRTVYVVYADTYEGSWGAEIEILGIADNNEDKDRIVAKAKDSRLLSKVAVVNLNKYCRTYLGGYYE